MAKKNFDENLDYQALIEQSVKQGDLHAAAEYELLRNEKIDYLDESGTNAYGATKTDKYSKYLKTESTAAESDAFRAGSGSVPDFTAGEPSWDSTAWDESKPNFDSAPWDESKPGYESSYSAQIDKLLGKILDRESFSYDAESDPLFQQYRSQYEREGQRAMNDTLASAAMDAGGMNSSAITAAQQAQNHYGAQLGDKIPELYKLAYSMYLDDADADVRALQLLQDVEDNQYSRYRDSVRDWEDGRDFAYDAYRDALSDWRDGRDFSYGSYRDDVGDWRDKRDFAYDSYRDSVADSRYESTQAYERVMDYLKSGVMPDSADLASAGVTSAAAAAILAAQGKKSSGSGSSGGGSVSGGSSTGAADWEAMYWEAMQSGSPASWLKQKANYGKYGLTSAPSFSDYENWYERSALGQGEAKREAYGTYYDAVATTAKGMAEKDAKAIAAYLQDMREKNHISSDGLSRLLDELRGEKRISAEKMTQLLRGLGLQG